MELTPLSRLCMGRMVVIYVQRFKPKSIRAYKGCASGLLYSVSNSCTSDGPISHSVQFNQCFAPSPPILNLEYTNNAIQLGHFGTIGISVQKILLVIVFNFVDTHRKPRVCSELVSEQARGWASPQGASVCDIRALLS